MDENKEKEVVKHGVEPRPVQAEKSGQGLREYKVTFRGELVYSINSILEEKGIENKYIVPHERWVGTRHGYIHFEEGEELTYQEALYYFGEEVSDIFDDYDAERREELITLAQENNGDVEFYTGDFYSEDLDEMYTGSYVGTVQIYARDEEDAKKKVKKIFEERGFDINIENIEEVQ